MTTMTTTSDSQARGTRIETAADNKQQKHAHKKPWQLQTSTKGKNSQENLTIRTKILNYSENRKQYYSSDRFHEPTEVVVARSAFTRQFSSVNCSNPACGGEAKIMQHILRVAHIVNGIFVSLKIAAGVMN